MLVESWLEFEVKSQQFLLLIAAISFSLFQHEKGTETGVARVEKFLPKRIKQKRKILTEDGVRVHRRSSDRFDSLRCVFQNDSGQWEEFMQLVFPDDEATQPHLKLLALAKRWKKGQEETETAAPAASQPSPEREPAPGPSAEDEDTEPLPQSRVDDEEMNDES